MEQPVDAGLPKKNTLSKADWDQWTKDTLVYNLIPILIIFFSSLSNSFTTHQALPSVGDLTLAAGAAYGSFLASMINLLAKYKSGV